MFETLLATLGNFVAYFVLALVYLSIFKFVYTKITPHDEWDLIKEGKNTTAAIAFGGAILGFSIAIAGVIKHSLSLVDFAVWALVALIAQLLAFGLVRFVYMPKIVSRIQENEISAGIMVAVISIAIGLLNAACMSY